MVVVFRDASTWLPALVRTTHASLSAVQPEYLIVYSTKEGLVDRSNSNAAWSVRFGHPLTWVNA